MRPVCVRFEQRQKMKRTVLIIEDDGNQLNMLRQLVLSVSADVEICTALNEVNAYAILMEKTIDVFLVDIILNAKKPGDTAGIRLVEKIRKMEKYMFAPVIFITSLEDPTMYCYTDLNCIGYIEKPFDPKRVKALVEKGLNYHTAREKEVVLSFRRDGILYPVELNKLVYAESFKHVMHIHLSNGKTLDIPYKTCKQLMDEADSDCLIQCSKNTVINKKFVESVDTVNRYITFENGLGQAEIGLTYKQKMSREFGKKKY